MESCVVRIGLNMAAQYAGCIAGLGDYSDISTTGFLIFVVTMIFIILLLS